MNFLYFLGCKIKRISTHTKYVIWISYAKFIKVLSYICQQPKPNTYIKCSDNVQPLNQYVLIMEDFQMLILRWCWTYLRPILVVKGGDLLRTFPTRMVHIDALTLINLAWYKVGATHFILTAESQSVGASLGRARYWRKWNALSADC